MADRIDEVVGLEAIPQVDKLTASLVAANNQMVETIKSAAKLNAITGNAKSFKEYATSVINSEKELNKMRLQQIKVEEAEIKLSNNRAAQAAKAEAQFARVEKAIRSNSKAITEQSRVYVQLDQTLTRLRKDAQDIGAVFGTNSVQFQKASERVRGLDLRLKDIDKQLGKSQRFVGEYERAGGRTFNGLANSISQLTREFPAFTFSVQTGFLALSNNIPIFFDQIRQTQLEIKALRAEGKQVPGLFKQIASSVFSAGTLLSVGITLITVFGKEIGNFISALFKGTTALDGFAEAQKTLNSTYRQGQKDAQTQLVSFQSLYRASQNQNLSLSERKKAVDQLQEQYPKYFANLKDEDILLGKVGDAYKKTTNEILASAIARAQENKIAALQAERIEIDFNDRVKAFEQRRLEIKLRAESAKLEKTQVDASGDAESRRASALGKSTSAAALNTAALINRLQVLKQEREEIERRKKVIDAVSKGLANSIDQSVVDNGINVLGSGGGKPTDTSKADLKNAQQLAQAQADLYKTIAEDFTESLEVRQDALDKYYQFSEQAIGLNGESQKQKDIDLLNFKKDFFKFQLELAKDYLSQEEQERLKAGQKTIDAINQEETLRLDLLNKTFADGIISEKQYDELRLQIQKDYATRFIGQEIKNIEDLLKVVTISDEVRADAEKKLAELKLKLSQAVADKQKADSAGVADQEKKDAAERARLAQELHDKKIELLKEVEELGITIIGAQYTRETNRNKEAIEQVDIRKEKEIEAVNASLASDQDKAAKIAVINARAQSQKEALDRRQRQIDLQRARFERAAAIARVIQETAIQVAKYGFFSPLALVAAGLGAASIATLIATPLPKFEKGGTKRGTGLAEIGHGTELRIDPDGKTSLTGSRPYVDLVKDGTKFISNRELIKMIARPDQPQYVVGQQIDIQELVRTQKEGTKQIVGALQTRKGTPGVRYYQTAKGRSYLNRNA